MGDGNMGARNAYHELGTRPASSSFSLTPPKAPWLFCFARYFGARSTLSWPQELRLWSVTNFPVFIGFQRRPGRSGHYRGAAGLDPATGSARGCSRGRGLLIRKNVIIASAVMFGFPAVDHWWLAEPGIMTFYGTSFRSE